MKMEYIYSALLLHSVNQPINVENLTKIVQATGASPDEAKIKAMVAALEGVNIEEALSKAAMPVAAAPAEAGAEKKEEKLEEDEEERAEKAVEGLAGLFG
jgi:large subunit ribosomal protein L12